MTGDQQPLFTDDSPPKVGNGRRRQRLILPKYLADASQDMRLVGDARDRAHAMLVKWADLESSGKLYRMKETSLEGEFLSQVFGEALGYTLFSENLPQWQLQAKFAVPGGEADAAIGLFAPDAEIVPRVLIELKGPKIDLDRHRDRGRTPVQQCWDYLYAVPDCPWGIVSNYVTFRLYHRNKTPQAYELFTLQDLRNTDRFLEFYALFERGALLPSPIGQTPRADALLHRTDTRQREVGKDLYRDYRENRLDLIRLLRAKPYQNSLDDAIHVVQKLLDRIIFIAFCEDRDLLPDKALERTWRDIGAWAQATNPRWESFKRLFRSIDEGNERAGITKYNGGLFKEDRAVDDLELPDARTDLFKEIGDYDFRDEVNVDVLGHLFEQSVTELENLRADPDAFESAPSKKVTGKRKREGIYYTPPHVTRYIVENTIKPSIEGRFSALAKRFKVDPDDEPTPQSMAAWIKFNEARLKTLRSLRVCDPACGSGAFLIQAYDYLEDVYDEVVTALCLRQGGGNEKLYEEISRTILRENLFGVDLSAEAVEITQLALWIRTARRGQSLSDLSDNVRCGNSLVDDSAVDPAAFDWRAAFPGVFKEGGFDCVIGNPPYIKLQNFRKRQPKIAEFLIERYRAAQTGNFDMYLPFIERGLELLRPDGRMGFIAPNVWLFNEYGRGLRELVAERNALARFVDFKSHQVFEDATTYTALQFFGATPARGIEVADAGHGDLRKLNWYNVSYTGLSTEAWALVSDREQGVLDTMRAGSVTLADASGGIIVGIQTSADAVYHLIKLGPGRYFSGALEDEVEIEDEIAKPLVSGEDAVPFATPPTDKYLIFPYVVSDKESRPYTGREMAKRFKRCWSYLRKNEKRLRGREDGKMNHDGWFGYVYPKNLDKQETPKLLVPRLLLNLFASGDPKGVAYLDNVDVGGVLIQKGWNLHYLLALLNSRACNFAWRTTSKPFRGEYRSANKQFIAPLPIPNTKDQRPLADLARKLAELHAKRLSASATVHRRFVTDLPPAKMLKTSPLPPGLSKKLQAFDESPTVHVFKEMEKLAERRLKPDEKADWDDYLSKQVKRVSEVKRRIADLMGELNDRAYRLYGLTDDEIRIVEDATGG